AGRDAASPNASAFMKQTTRLDKKRGARRPPFDHALDASGLESPARRNTESSRRLVSIDLQEIRIGNSRRGLDVVVETRCFLGVEHVENVERKSQGRVLDLELVAAVQIE